MKKWKTRLLVMGTKLSAIAVLVASVLSPICRNEWYEPKKPSNLDQLLKSKDQIRR